MTPLSPSAREALLRSEITASLSDNQEIFASLLNSESNADVHFRLFDLDSTPACLLYIEGMADESRLASFVLHARSSADATTPATPDAIVRRVLEIPQCELESRVSEILACVVGGMSALFIEGAAEAVLLETRGFPARPVGQPTNESVVVGAQEGFVESLRTNMTLLRRYVQSPRLVTECLSVGTQTTCRVTLAYVEGTASEATVREARRRLQRISKASVLGLGEVQQLIEDQPFAILPQLLQTERPDRAASCLLDGQVALLAENSPYALIAPATLFHFLHASDDSFARWQYGSFLRIVRVLGTALTVFLPGLYVALTNHHTYLIPLSLLGSIAEARANVPFPVLAEILLMEFSFYLINEAGTRIPRQIGSALGIVGALILGQAAVSAAIISPILIIIVALTGLGSYAVPDYGFSVGLILYRLFVILCGAALGLYGVCVAGFCLLVGLCAMRSLGQPFLTPVAPARPHGPDILLRLPVWLQRRAPLFGGRGKEQA